MFGDFSPEHRETVEAIAYQLHHMSQQALISPPVSPDISMCVNDFEDESVELNGEIDEPMFLPSDSDELFFPF